mmetsp:Transcript_25130/g.76265  ORF Transcript_25130/g.76265 Transcript_25130/m.76265 type:complete len:254 (-) Transcript_25130:214-975(-)|eukprot:scaffold49661_cov22-Tisochrysis_lutea.AAC.2
MPRTRIGEETKDETLGLVWLGLPLPLALGDPNCALCWSGTSRETGVSARTSRVHRLTPPISYSYFFAAVRLATRSPPSLRSGARSPCPGTCRFLPGAVLPPSRWPRPSDGSDSGASVRRSPWARRRDSRQISPSVRMSVCARNSRHRLRSSTRAATWSGSSVGRCTSPDSSASGAAGGAEMRLCNEWRRMIGARVSGVGGGPAWLSASSSSARALAWDGSGESGANGERGSPSAGERSAMSCSMGWLISARTS